MPDFDAPLEDFRSIWNEEYETLRMSVYVVRAFVRLREVLATHKDLARKLEQLAKKCDAQFHVVFDAIRQLLTPTPGPPKKRIGFHVRPEES